MLHLHFLQLSPFFQPLKPTWNKHSTWSPCCFLISPKGGWVVNKLSIKSTKLQWTFESDSWYQKLLYEKENFEETFWKRKWYDRHTCKEHPMTDWNTGTYLKNPWSLKNVFNVVSYWYIIAHAQNIHCWRSGSDITMKSSSYEKGFNGRTSLVNCENLLIQVLFTHQLSWGIYLQKIVPSDYSLFSRIWIIVKYKIQTVIGFKRLTCLVATPFPHKHSHFYHDQHILFIYYQGYFWW